MLKIVLLERSRGEDVGDEGTRTLGFFFVVDELFVNLWW